MRAANDAARAQLRPLAPGERPLAVKLSAALAAAIAISNVVLLATGWKLEGVEQPTLVQSLGLPLFMAALAVGIWLKRYWALLAWQGVLGITILFAFLLLMRASNFQGVLLCAGLLGVSTPLFFFLVKAMARIQMPAGASRAVRAAGPDETTR